MAELGSLSVDIQPPAPRILRFRELGFGMFIHWGLYSQLGIGEWAWTYHPHLRENYRDLQKNFTAEDFDAEAWCQLAVSAGMRYICLTTRHHEGFSLYDTKGLNDYDAPHSPAGRDLIAEFSAACEKYQLGKFFYHTTLDWWHPDFEGNWDAYQKYLRDSIAILCENYGTVDGLWFDGNWAHPDRDWQEDALYAVIRERQPEAMIINNSSIGNHGAVGHPETDVATFEQGEVGAVSTADGKVRAAEMCETMNSHWGIGAHDLSYKNPADIIQRLSQCRSFQANLLLNVGPTAQGGIPEYEGAVLRQVGRWSTMAEPALYAAEPATDLTCHGDDFILLGKDGHYYYFCHNVPIHGNRHLLSGAAGDGPQAIQGPLPKIKTITWLDEPDSSLEFTQGKDVLGFIATPYPYGSQLIVRIARLTPA